MENLLPNFQFRRQPFVAGLCVFIVLLFGGVTVKQNSLALGTISGHAITVSSPPAKEKMVRRGKWLYNRILKKLIRPDGAFSGLAFVVNIIMISAGILALLFGIWAVSLLVVGDTIGLFIGLLSLACLALFIILAFNL